MSTHQHRRLRVLAHFNAWRRRHVSDAMFLISLAALVGGAVGVGAYLLKVAINGLASGLILLNNISGVGWGAAMFPLIGIFLTLIYQRCVAHRSLMRGVEQLSNAMRQGNYALNPHLIYSPLVASAITLGFGGSAGAEGPIAYAGAAIGSNLAGAAKAGRDKMRIMVACGAAAGIAGIFKAPVGGVLFSLEVLRVELTTLSVMALVVACVVSSLTCCLCSGFTLSIDFHSMAPFAPELFLWVVGLGVFCGIYSVYYSAVLDYMEARYIASSRKWPVALVGGGILAVAVFLLPALYGEGYDVATKIVNGHVLSVMTGCWWAGGFSSSIALAVALFGILLLKSAAVASTNSAGGVAGDFAPTIFAGTIAGALFALAVNYFFGANLPVGNFALMATAGVFAGVIHAPLMAMFLIAEMAGAYAFFPGLAVVATVAYITMKLITPQTTYKQSLTDDFVSLRNR